MRISDWSSDVCSSDLLGGFLAKADASGVPPLDQIQAEGAYIKWDFEIETDRGEAAIRDVFEFVLDDCDLEITCLNPPADKPAAEKPAAAAEAKKPAEAPAAEIGIAHV